MFGPGVTTLAGRHLILLEGAPEAALRAVRGLFAATAVELVTMALAEHDRLMARVLVLAHALNIAFASTLAGSGESSPQLAAVASTTFARQLAIARDVVHENPALYFEIQHLAPEAAMARRELAATLASLERMIQGGDEEGFAALMSAAGRWFAAGFEAVP
ncbi:MAG: hypothetical protein RML12_07265 [Xanthomonadales bacterium]|nr:hypothetical protein [Xanthomonadales bacterium]